MDTGGTAQEEVAHIQTLFDELRRAGVSEKSVFRQALDVSDDARDKIGKRARKALCTFLRDVASTDADVRIALAHAERLLAGEAPSAPASTEPEWVTRRANGVIPSALADIHPLMREALFPS